MNQIEKRRKEYLGALKAHYQSITNFEAGRAPEDSILPMPHWKKYLAQTLAEAILDLLPKGWTVDVLGPFGLGARCGIYFRRPDGSRAGGLLIEPGNLGEKGELLLVDLSTDTGQYRPGTIGHLNGFNHPAIQLPSLEELATRAKGESQ